MSAAAFRLAVRVAGPAEDAAEGHVLDPVYDALTVVVDDLLAVDYWMGESLDGETLEPAEPGVVVFLFSVEPYPGASVMALGRRLTELLTDLAQQPGIRRAEFA
jgi:hypothetical protein